MPEEMNSRLLEEIRALRARVAQLEHEAAASGRAREASESFNQVARDLAGTLDVAQAADRVVTAVLQLFRVRLAILYQLDPASGSLTCIASAGDVGTQQWIGRSLPRGAGVAGLAIAQGRPIWSPNVLLDPRITVPEWVVERIREGGYRAVAGVPLMARGDMLGALLLADTHGRVFTEADLRLLSAFADQAALMQENARLHAETERQRREAEFVAERRRAEEALRQNEQQVRQAQKMEARGQPGDGTVHEFANFLAVIMLHADSVLTELAETHPIRWHIAAIKGAAEQATALIRQLRALGRKQVLKPKVFDPRLVVADVGALLRPLMRKDIHLTIVQAPGLGCVKADPGQLQQVLLNLAANAGDAMPRGGQLTIATTNVELDQASAAQRFGARPGPYVMLEVQDTGSGMDAETRARVHELFSATKEEGSGAGHGLSAVCGIVKQHDGYIALDSEVGRGTTFRVFFPRIGTAIGPVEDVRLRPGMARGSETILLVDDDEGVRPVLAQILSGRGYTVLEAADGPEAFLVSERHARPIHLLLTDVVLPGMRGPEVAVRLTALRPDMKVVYMSGYAGDALTPHGVVDTAAVILEKPFTGPTLLGTVREALDARGSDERA